MDFGLLGAAAESEKKRQNAAGAGIKVVQKEPTKGVVDPSMMSRMMEQIGVSPARMRTGQVLEDSLRASPENNKTQLPLFGSAIISPVRTGAFQRFHQTEALKKAEGTGVVAPPAPALER